MSILLAPVKDEDVEIKPDGKVCIRFSCDTYSSSLPRYDLSSGNKVSSNHEPSVRSRGLGADALRRQHAFSRKLTFQLLF